MGRSHEKSSLNDTFAAGGGNPRSESSEQFFKKLGWVEIVNTHNMRKYVFLKSSHILYNPRNITDPAKSKTDSWANVYRDGRTFSKQKPGFSFWMYEMC